MFLRLLAAAQPELVGIRPVNVIVASRVEERLTSRRCRQSNRSSTAGALLSEPGASNTIIEAAVPYAREAFDDYVAPSNPPSQYASREAAACLAVAAMRRARQLSALSSATVSHLVHGPRLAGIGSAAALVADRPRKGDHHIHVCTATDEYASYYELKLEKGQRDRAGEERVAGAMVVLAVADAVDAGASQHATQPPAADSDNSTGWGTGNEGSRRSSNGGAPATGPVTAVQQSLMESVLTGIKRKWTAATAAGVDKDTEAAQAECLYRSTRQFDADPLLRLLQSDATPAAASNGIDGGGGGGIVTHVLFAPAPPPTDLAAALFTAKTLSSAASSSSSSDAAAAPSPPSPSVARLRSAERDQQRAGSFILNAPLHPRCIVLPGSFNPVHEGHINMGSAAVEAMRRHNRRDKSNGSADGTKCSNVDDRHDWEVVFELSATNVDKPPVPLPTLWSRVQQFVNVRQPTQAQVADSAALGAQAFTAPTQGAALPASRSSSSASASTVSTPRQYPIVITRAPRFIDKALLFPGCSFAIGYDTAARLINPKYYKGGDENEMIAALFALQLKGTRFLVAGRLESAAPVATPITPLPLSTSMSAGAAPADSPVASPTMADDADRFLTLDDLLPSIPPILRPMFIGISESEFRSDVSSTQIRKQKVASAGAAPSEAQ